MEVIRGLDKITDNHKGCVATIGAFDGVHLGHQSVLKRLTDISYDLGLPSLVITLEPLPREFFSPQCAPPRLMSFDEKALIMGNLGIDRILRIDFNKNLSRVSAENFIKDIFYKSLGIQYIIIGDDLRFGHLRKGDFQLLKTMGKNLGFQVEATKTLEVSGSRVSSTRIRNAVASSDFLLSETLLGRPYFIHGKVIKGTGTGSSLGFPTINVALNRVKPAISGVYATNTLINGSLYFGVAYVNSCYFKGIKAENHISVYLFDFQGELFGSYITIDLIHKLRDEYNVTTPDQAKKEMHKDCRVVKQHISLSNIITASSNKGSALSVTP